MKSPRMLATAAAALVLITTTQALADGKHKHSFAPDVEAFHAQLSPLWHAPASPERSAAICKAAPELDRLAGAISSTDAKHLKSQVEQLQKQCSNNASDIEAPFTAVHDAFHQLTDAH